jgi:integrase
MSSIQKRSGKLPYIAQFTRGSGTDRIRQDKSFRTKKEARDWLYQIENDFVNGSSFKKSKMQFIDYYKDWVKLYKEPVVCLATLESYRVSEDHFRRGNLATTRMDELTRDKIQMFFNNLNLAHETARKDLGHLRACLRDAYDDGVLNRNPAGGRIRVVADPKKTKPDDRKFMAIKDFRKVQNFLLEYDYRLSDVNRMVLMVISQTALRVGEALALKYEDINQFKCEISIDESWDSMHNLFKEPKTKNSIRTVPVSREAMNKIVKWIEFHRRELFRRGVANPEQLLFQNRQAKLPYSNSINSAYHQLQKHLGMESKFSTHTMRHTLASMMLATGEVSLAYISHYLGHANIMITQKYYIGLLPEQVENESAKVVEIVGFG